MNRGSRIVRPLVIGLVVAGISMIASSRADDKG